jgi:hypothetical protein
LAKDQTSATVEWWCSYDKPEDVGYFGTWTFFFPLGFALTKCYYRLRNY